MVKLVLRMLHPSINRTLAQHMLDCYASMDVLLYVYVCNTYVHIYCKLCCCTAKAQNMGLLKQLMPYKHSNDLLKLGSCHCSRQVLHAAVLLWTAEMHSCYSCCCCALVKH